jgi:hypothetical protein
MIADGLTRALAKERHRQLMQKMGIKRSERLEKGGRDHYAITKLKP